MLRIVAPNPGPMTLEGTNTYVVGAAPAWVVDPGPAIDSHIAAVRDAADSRGGIAGIVLTHSHADHSAGVAMLDAPLVWGEISDLDEGAVLPSLRAPTSGQDSPVREGGELGAGGRVGPFEVMPTPGHASDHVCFAWRPEPGSDGPVIFCGDLVLGTGSSIVPPRSMGGSLADCMDSLRRLAQAGPELMCPGHGPWITDPATKLSEYIEHRLERERKLVAALDAGERERERLLDAAWDDVPAAMRAAATLAMTAHLEKLEDEGRLPDDVSP